MAREVGREEKLGKEWEGGVDGQLLNGEHTVERDMDRDKKGILIKV